MVLQGMFYVTFFPIIIIIMPIIWTKTDLGKNTNNG